MSKSKNHLSAKEKEIVRDLCEDLIVEAGARSLRDQCFEKGTGFYEVDGTAIIPAGVLRSAFNTERLKELEKAGLVEYGRTRGNKANYRVYRVKIGSKPPKDVTADNAVTLKENASRSEIYKLQSEVRRLKQENKELRKEMSAEELAKKYLRAAIHRGLNPHKPPKPKGGKKKHKDELVDVLFLSDLHWDEVVNPLEVMGLNEYNREIAIKRLGRVCRKFLDFSLGNRYGYTPENICIMFGGDMVSGHIHEELARVT